MSWMNQLIIAPILLPLLTAALMMMLGEKHRPLKAKINLLSSMTGLGIAMLMLYWTQKGGRPPSAFTCQAIGRCHSASCWWWINCRP